jgi:hypothetical protein
MAEIASVKQSLVRRCMDGLEVHELAGPIRKTHSAGARLLDDS